MHGISLNKKLEEERRISV